MENHYHLMLETPRGNLSQAMHHINSAYTVSSNLRNKRVGHLFQGRYKSILIDSEAYALEVSRYLHLNPARAGIAGDPFTYRWSSLGAYVGRRVVPDWLTTDYVLSYFRRPESRRRIAYRRFVASGMRGTRKNPFEDTFASSILGRERFIEAVKERFLSNTKTSPDIPATRKIREQPSIPMVIDAVQSVFSGNSRIERQATLHFCRLYSGVRIREIGAYFNISGAAVSLSSHRFTKKLAQDVKLKEGVKKVEAILNC